MLNVRASARSSAASRHAWLALKQAAVKRALMTFIACMVPIRLISTVNDDMWCTGRHALAARERRWRLERRTASEIESAANPRLNG